MLLGAQISTLNIESEILSCGLNHSMWKPRTVTDHGACNPFPLTHQTKGLSLQECESDKPFTPTPSTHNFE